MEGELSDLNTAVAAAQAEVERMSSMVGDEEKRLTQFRMQVPRILFFFSLFAWRQLLTATKTQFLRFLR